MSSFGKIDVDLAKSSFRAGGMAEGWISLELYRELHYGCVISLRLSGEESTEIQSVVIVKRTVRLEQLFEADHVAEVESTQFKSNAEKLTIIDREFVLFNNMGSNFPPGQYSFPFSFPLDKGLPSNFFFSPRDLFTKQQKEKYGFPYAIITYKLEAKLKAYDSTEPDLIVRIKSFNINQAVDERPIDSGTLTRAVNSFCCFSKGHVTFSVRAEKPVVYIREDLDLTVEIDNSKCVVDISSIKVTLRSMAKLKSLDQSLEHEGGFIVYNFEGIRAGETRVGDKAIKLKLFVEWILMLRAYFGPTTKGKNFSFRNYLTVELVMDACMCCRSCPTFSTEIPLLQSEKVYSPPKITSSWNPVTMGPPVQMYNTSVNPVNSLQRPSAPQIPQTMAQPAAPIKPNSVMPLTTSTSPHQQTSPPKLPQSEVKPSPELTKPQENAELERLKEDASTNRLKQP